jgi:hypothetical protein
MAIITANAAVLNIAGEAAICPKSLTFQADLELKDLQCSASNGFKRSAAGNVSWQGSGSFILDSGSGLSGADVLNAVKNRALIAISLAITGGPTITGNAFMTNAQLNIPENNDPIEVSFTYTGDDSFTIA